MWDLLRSNAVWFSVHIRRLATSKTNVSATTEPSVISEAGLMKRLFSDCKFSADWPADDLRWPQFPDFLFFYYCLDSIVSTLLIVMSSRPPLETSWRYKLPGLAALYSCQVGFPLLSVLCSSLARAEGVNMTKLMWMSVCCKHIQTVYSTETYG